MNINIFVFFLWIFFLYSCNNDSFSRKIHISNDGDLHTIEYSDIKVVISSEKGGRILSYTCNGKELLLPSSIHKENYGATLWPSPQKDWGWPPYPVLDIEPYETKILRDTLFLESQNDTLSGYSFRKKFYISTSDTSLVIDYYIYNCSKEIKKVAAWDVCRTKGGISFFPIGECGILDNSNLEGVSKCENILVYRCDSTLLNSPQKLFSSATNGWLAHVVGGLLFVERFPDISVEDLPPGQGEVEIFVQEDGLYIELENHGAYTTLKPGEHLSYHQKWFLRDIGGNNRFTNVFDKIVDIIKN